MFAGKLTLYCNVLCCNLASPGLVLRSYQSWVDFSGGASGQSSEIRSQQFASCSSPFLPTTLLQPLNSPLTDLKCSPFWDFSGIHVQNLQQKAHRYTTASDSPRGAGIPSNFCFSCGKSENQDQQMAKHMWLNETLFGVANIYKTYFQSLDLGSSCAFL